MNGGIYEILALLMRYVFVLIGALIVWRSFRWLRRDANAYKREMRSLPDAGLIGEIVDLSDGRAQPLPREGYIGASRECDIRVKSGGISGRHARFEFEEGRGLKIIPGYGKRVLLSGEEMNGPGYALHGTLVQLGDSLLRIRLFAGLKVPYFAPYAGENDRDASLPSECGHEESMPQYSTLLQGFSNDDDAYLPYDPALTPMEGSRRREEMYDGGYTDGGQMTWQYAYSLEELEKEMDNPPPFGTGESPDETDNEGVPYQSPLQPRRRRRSRHE